MNSEVAYVEIFPPIGIARIGDSTEYFFAPEVPGLTNYPIGSDGQPITAFRDKNQQILRQAVRFRVYGFDNQNNCIEEITTQGGYTLTWKVQVANTKAAALEFRGRFRDETDKYRNPDVEDRDKLRITANTEITSGMGTSGEKLIGQFQGSASTPTEVYLGEVLVDACGRLIFLGGHGRAECVRGELNPDILSEFDSLDWFDDVCDGWIEVTVSNGMQSRSADHKATVISALPKFAWGMNDSISLYDIMENIYHKNTQAESAETNFYRDIWPVFFSACATAWTNEIASQGHGPHGRGYFIDREAELSALPGEDDKYRHLRESIFQKIRQPGNLDQANTKYMPRLSGDDGDAIEPGDIQRRYLKNPIGRFAALTPLQYERFENWAKGLFIQGAKGDSCLPPDVQNHPELLTRAILEQTTACSLYPGIEVYWIAYDSKIYDFSSPVQPPFRIDYQNGVKPGDLTERLSLPWQSDYSLCNTHWWPFARPDQVVVSDDEKRKEWARGLRVSPDDLSSFPGSTDMVKYWSNLGFIVKEQDEFKWVEQERQPIS